MVDLVIWPCCVHVRMLTCYSYHYILSIQIHVGVGNTQTDGSAPGELKYANVYYVPNSVCGNFIFGGIDESSMCAGDFEVEVRF